MINILHIAKFYPLSNSPTARNKLTIAKYLNPSKFTSYGYGIDPHYPSNLRGIRRDNPFFALLDTLKHNIDIVHTRANPSELAMRFFIKLKNMRSKHILTFHGMPFRNEGHYHFSKIMANDAHTITSVSKTTAEQLENQFGFNSKVIYMGRDLNIFKPINHNNERPRVLFVGRYIYSKHPEIIIRVARHFPKCDFCLYGEGYMEQFLRDQAKKLGNVYVNNPMPFTKMPQIYNKSDLFLYPSTQEGLSNVVIEAMASGLPIISFNVSSFHECITHGKNGFLASNLKEMKSYLEMLIQDESLRNIFSNKSRLLSKKFDWKKISKQWEQLYEEVYFS